MFTNICWSIELTILCERIPSSKSLWQAWRYPAARLWWCSIYVSFSANSCTLYNRNSEWLLYTYTHACKPNSQYDIHKKVLPALRTSNYYSQYRKGEVNHGEMAIVLASLCLQRIFIKERSSLAASKNSAQTPNSNCIKANVILTTMPSRNFASW